jgi:nucleoside-diphosphate-sugar epimerase
VVVHSAAATRFDLRREEVLAVNVDGTRHVLELAADAGARVVALSTAFVRTDYSAEVGWLTPKHYLESKRAAEALVSGSGLDWHIVRPSIVIGAPETDPTTRFQGFHFWANALVRGQLPLIPVDRTDLLDFVPAGLVGDVLASIADTPPPWRESWVTAGSEAWFAPRVIEAVLRIGAERGHEVERPRLMAADAVDRLVRPVFFPELPKRIVRRYDQVTAVSVVVVTREPFESSLPELRCLYGRELDLDLERTLEGMIVSLLEPEREAVGA